LLKPVTILTSGYAFLIFLVVSKVIRPFLSLVPIGTTKGSMNISLKESPAPTNISINFSAISSLVSGLSGIPLSSKARAITPH